MGNSHLCLVDFSDLPFERANLSLVSLLVLMCRDSGVYDAPGLRQDPGLVKSFLLWEFWDCPPEVRNQAVNYIGGLRRSKWKLRQRQG